MNFSDLNKPEYKPVYHQLKPSPSWPFWAIFALGIGIAVVAAWLMWGGGK